MLDRQPDHIAPSHETRRPKPTPIRCDARWRSADGSLTAAINRLIELLEKKEPPRKRRRRASDTATLRLAIECIACNLLAVSIATTERPLAVPLANAASKLAPIFGKPARKVINLMIGLGFVNKVKGYPYRGPTTVRPTPKLRKHLPLGKVDWNMLHIQSDPNVVILKENRGEGANFDDDATTIRARRSLAKDKRWLSAITVEMRTINAAIRSAPIICHGSAMFHIATRPGAAMASLVTYHNRALRRIFNDNWELGGRLFGGFWQTMPRADRYRHIRIGGEPVALVDYGQLFMRLAYAEAGAKPPPGDLYDMTGNDASCPNWMRLREARKKLVSALFFSKALLKQWPGAIPALRDEIRHAFPRGTKPCDAIRAIEEKHAPIAHLFGCGCGLRFMRMESDLIVAVTLALFKQGIVALPIHDAVLVPKRHASTARSVMQKEAKRLTGAYIPADIQNAQK